MKYKKPVNKYRLERKFLSSDFTDEEVSTMLKFHDFIFREIYPQRFVNNMYFDFENFSLYEQSINGDMNRSKIRIRWYGKFLGWIKEPILEVKSKIGLAGNKEHYQLKPFLLSENMTNNKLQQIFSKSTIPYEIKSQLKSLKCTLINRYKRQYFRSSDGKIRLTIDSHLEYFQPSFGKQIFIRKIAKSQETILEIKYSNEYDELVQKFTNTLPFRLAKNSKYTRGIDLIWN